MVHDITLWLQIHQGIFTNISYFIMAVGVIQSLVYILQLPLAALELFKIRIRDQKSYTNWLIKSDITLPISIFIPAYNEEVTIIKSVTTSLALEYPTYEVIVINDGSKDLTLQKLIKEFELSPSNRPYESQVDCEELKQIYESTIHDNLVVIDKKNGGKADAMNAAINLAKYPVFCTLDADSILEPSALLRSMSPFIEEPEKTVAVGGTVRILNSCKIKNGIVRQAILPKKFVPRFQIVEYLRAYLMGRLAWSRLGILTIVSGAFAVLQREVVIKVGGFNKNTMGEDYDLILKIHKYMRDNKEDYQIHFIPEPVCWTEVPESLSILRGQRIRWQQGALEGFFNNMDMFFNPKYGKIGLLSFPLSFVMDVLGPLTEALGYIMVPILYLLGILSFEFFIAFIALFFVLGIFTSVMSLVLEELSLKRFKDASGLISLGITAIAENFGYRQINNIWRIVGWWRFVRGQKIWGEMTRTGS